MLTKEGVAEILNAGVLLLTDGVPDKARGLLKVVGDRAPHGVRHAIAGGIFCGGGVMEMHQPLSERVDAQFSDLPGREQGSERAFGRQAPHADQILNDRGLAHVDHFPQVIIITDPQQGHDAKVDCRCQPMIQAHFFVTELLPQCERRIIHKREAHGLLELVHFLTGQEDGGDVSLDHLHVIGMMGVTSGLL